MTKLRMTQRRTLLNKTRAQVERKLKAVAEKSLKKRFKALQRELRRAGFNRKALKKTDGLYKDAASEWADWIGTFEANLTEVMLEGVNMLFGAENTFWTSRDMPPVESWDSQQVVDAYQTRIGKRIKNIGEDTLTQTQTKIADWYNGEETLPDLIASLENLFSPARAEMIAVTEATGLAAQVGGEMMSHFGVSQWRWDAFNDKLVCEVCADLNGETFDASDNDSYPPAHPNCRCGQFFLLEDDESAAKFVLPEFVKKHVNLLPIVTKEQAERKGWL